MRPEARPLVLGGESLLGGAIRRALLQAGRLPLPASPAAEPELTDPCAVERLFAETRPTHVFLAAGPSGGIAANQRRPVELMHANLLIAVHALAAARRAGVERLLYLASSCSYPRLAPQPMREEALFSGPLEPTNQAYATAKLAGLVLCQAYAQQYGARFQAAIPANAYGPGDDFRPEEAHVIPGLIARLHAAKLAGAPEVAVWGSGAARREFVFAEDLAEAALTVMECAACPDPINLGGGEEVSIAELAERVREVVGYTGRLRFDPGRPDGMPVKRLDGTRLARLGWRPRTPLAEGLARTYRWYLAQGAGEGDRHGR